ncbi:MAG: ATP-dependent zinc metalloprotease FtsH [Phycisphaerae bacterium]|nr:ATP-dependent zinc metalloprotease FtsH [Phycisphaerae bacterium]
MADNKARKNKKPLPPINPKGGKKGPALTYRNSPFSWILIAVTLMALFMFLRKQTNDTIGWNDFTAYFKNGQVESIEISDMSIKGKFNQAGIESRDSDQPNTFTVDYKSDVVGEQLGEMLKNSPEVKVVMPQAKTWIMNLISMFLPIIILVGLFYFLFARNLKGGAGGMLMSFGRSKHRLHGKDKMKVTFKDVAGIEEAKDEVTELIEFLRNPKKFQRLGGRIPRGVLLVGPPGCGKTLLAKAIAGEADVPFFSISGSDFVEMFVGVGASRVRDLFKQAKDNSPCIIFLDEIDAIGRKRGAGFAGGGHDEREQTLNAILVEMDGFDTNDQVIVIAATNRGDILDHALTRPGRFDRQVVVPLPDLKGRLEILQVHARKVKMATDADFEKLARGTPMFSGADLAAIINEAALAATMMNKDSIETADLEEARDKVRWGRAKKSRVVDVNEKEITAYHEAGHTLVQCLLKEADPLHKVSIIPRGPMGGATFALPEKDRTIFTRKYCMALLQVCFGGRISEEMFCDDISSGAQADIMQATRIARQMVVTWGMSDKLGLISYENDSGMNNEYYVMPGEKDYSEKTAELIDGEIKRIIDEAYARATEIIKENKDTLERIEKALLKYETLSAEDVKRIVDGEELARPTVADLIAAEQAKEHPKPEEKEQAKGNKEQQS